jgi:hypothetical protein
MTSTKTVGFTAGGVRIKKIRFGSQEAIAKELSTLENMKYNWKNALTKKGTYNEGMAKFQNRKLAELSGNALMKPNQYGAHGPTHTEPVIGEITKLWKSSPTLQSKYTLQEFKVAARLHDTGRIYGSSKFGETEPIAHGPSVAANIRAGRINDPELLSLSKASQNRIAKAIETHMTIRPGNSWYMRPSDFQKALASADRLARAKDAGYLRSGMVFKLPEETVGFKLKTMLSKAENESRFLRDTTAELAPIRRRNFTSSEIENIKTFRVVDELKNAELKSKNKVMHIDNEYVKKPNSKGFAAYKKPSDINWKPIKGAAYRAPIKSADYHVASASNFPKILQSAESEYKKSVGEGYTISKGKGKFLPSNFPEYPQKKGNGYKPKADGYKPRAAGYKPTPGTYKPAPGKGYTPNPGGKYKPTPSGYTPKPSGGNYPTPKPIKVGYAGGKTTPPKYIPKPTDSGIIIKKKKANDGIVKQIRALQKAKRVLKNNVGTLIY